MEWSDLLVGVPWAKDGYGRLGLSLVFSSGLTGGVPDFAEEEVALGLCFSRIPPGLQS